MTSPISTLRGTIATALTSASDWDTFAFPPLTIVAKSVVVAPSDPYIVPNNNSQAGIAPMANFKIIMSQPMFDNQGALINIEDMIVAVFNKLASSAIVFNVTSASAPSILETASGTFLTSDFQISVLTSWS
jgi:hypothetical protein